jgi:anti-anti-sigma factor
VPAPPPEAREPLVLAGDVDVDNADAKFVDLLEQAARSGDDLPGEIEIDCAGVTFLGSAGLAMLVKLRSRLGRRIALVRAPPTVRHPFELAGLDRIFDLRD